MSPMQNALDKFLSKMNPTIQDAFIAGWDARNNHVYGRAAFELELCRELLVQVSDLQLSNGHAEKAKNLLERINDQHD